MTLPDSRSRTPVPPQSGYPAADDLGFELPRANRISKGRLLRLGAVLLAGLVAAFLFGYLPRHHAKSELAEGAQAEHDAIPRVEVVHPKTTTSERAIVLSGSVRALEETVVYPRASGYVASWQADIGDRVKEGQVLAEVETPELDQELDQARAQLAQAVAAVSQAGANQEFSRVNLERFKLLVPAGVASQQDLDKSQAQSLVDSASVSVAHSGVAVQQANIRRLLKLKSFAHVLAPFAGTVTERNVERGALVSGGTATPLFKIAATDPARVFVQVPQDVAGGVRVDLDVKITLREFPGRVFFGKVARSAGALDPATRTMLTEIRVPNPKNELLAGMYSEVALTLPSSHRVFEIPATALINDAKGLRVAIVDGEGKLRLKQIAIERDTGATLQVSSGIEAEDRVVKLASADLADGKSVQVRK